MLPSDVREAALDPRRRIGRYVSVRDLGRGAVGAVVEAWDLKLGRRVALKLLLSGGRASRVQLARFEREARACARVVHPGIVGILDVGEHEGQPFLAFELVQGETLHALLEREGRLPAPRAATLVRDMARALEAAHQQGILHRDVKPQNVLVDRGGRPRLTDFGLARVHDEERAAALTRTGTVLGTPLYMAPEQAGQSSAGHGPPCDVYALGAILYRALCGRVPIEAESLAEQVQLLKHEAPPAPRSVEPSVPPALEAIVLRCLEKAPPARFAHAGALADALDAWLATPAPAPRRGIGVVVRSLLAGIGAVAVCAGVATIAVHLAAPPPEQPAPAATPRPDSPAPPAPPGLESAPRSGTTSRRGLLQVTGVRGDNRWMHATPATALDLTCDGKRLVTGDGHWTREHGARLYTWDAVTGDPLGAFSIGGRDIVTFVAAAPHDPRLALAGCASGELALWNVESGERVGTLARANERRRPCGAAFVRDATPAESEAGPTVAVAWSDGVIEVWGDLPTGPMSTTRPRIVRMLGEGPLAHDVATGVRALPGGRLVSWASSLQPVTMWDVRSGQRVEVVDDRGALQVVVSTGGRMAILVPRPDNVSEGTELIQVVGGGGADVLVQATGVTCVAWCGEGQLVTGDRSGRLALADLEARPPTPRPLSMGHAVGFPVVACRALSERVVVTVSEDLTVGRFDPRSGDLRRLPHDAAPGWISSVAPLGGTRVACARSLGFAFGTASEMDLATGVEIARLATRQEWVRGFGVTASRGVLLVGSNGEPDDVVLWTPEPASRAGRVAGRAHDETRAGDVRLGAGGLVGGVVLTLGEDGSWRTWEATADLRPIAHGMLEAPESITAVAPWPDGSRAVLTGQSGSLRLVDAGALGGGAAPGGPRAQAGCGLLAACVAAPRGGRPLVVLGATDGQVLTWTPDDPEAPVRLLGRHELGVTAAAASPDGARALTASRDGAVRLWDLAGRRELDLLDLGAWGDASDGLAFLPGGDAVVTTRRGLVLVVALR